MADILFKRSSTPSAVPLTTDLALGAIAINTYDGKLFIRKDSGSPTIVQVGGIHNHAASEITSGTLTYSRLPAELQLLAANSFGAI